MLNHDSYACPKCRDCGVFPGDGFAEWASCLCEAGRLRCTQGSDYVEPLEGEVESEDAPVEAGLFDLESGTFPRGSLRLSRFAVRAENDPRDLVERTEEDLLTASHAVRFQAAFGKSGR